MSYTLGYGPNNCANLVVLDNESNTVGNITFPGRNFSGYGSPVDQNFLSMIENFASSNGGPSNPITGQLWFDAGSTTANAVSNVFDGAKLKFNVSNTSGKSNIAPVWWELIYASNAGVNLGSTGNIIIGNTSANYIRLEANTGNIFTTGHIIVASPGTFRIEPDGDIITDGNILANGTIISNSNITGANLLSSGNIIANNITANGNINGNNLAISNLANIGGDVIITGNLTVQGNTTYIGGNSNLSTNDTIIVLANNTSGPDVYDRGVAMRYWTGAVSTSFMGWETGNSEFLFASNSDISTGDLTGITLGNIRGSSVNFANGSFAGNVNPTANLTYDLGTAALRWGNIFGGNLSLSGNLSVTGSIAGTTGAPGGAGSNTQILFNDIGLVSSNTNFTFDKVTGNINVPGNVSASGNLTAGGSLNGTLSAGSAAQPNVTSLGTLTDLSVTGNATFSANVITTRITTGAVATGGTITGQWTLVGASTLEATYADFAERHHSDHEYPAGTVMTVGGANEITAARIGDSVIGVISEKYAYLMNSGAGPQETHPAVAYTGRVPVRIVGPISKHDRLEPTEKGCAKKSVKGKNSFGWSLETNTSPEEKLVLCIIK